MATASGKRTYNSPLRERQAAATRQEILQAAAELILADGVADFSLRYVARRAGVSERTVYYHFPNRQAVLDGLNDLVDDRLRELDLQADPRDIDDVPGRIEAVFNAFDEIGAPARAMARLASAQGLRSKAHDERTDAFRERFADVLDELPPQEADRCFAVIRHLISSGTWLTLHEEFDLSGPDTARATVWAVETLLTDLRRRASGGRPARRGQGSRRTRRRTG